MLDLLERPIQKHAMISPCGTYRYRLERFWGPEHALPFVMLNPSTADADIDDPTIRRCMGFARREGAGGIIVVNLFAFRATDPKNLPDGAARVGPENEFYLHAVADWAKRAGVPLVCAWGAHPEANAHFSVERWRCMGVTLKCLGKTSKGHPRHPLYVKGDQPLIAL